MNNVYCGDDYKPIYEKTQALIPVLKPILNSKFNLEGLSNYKGDIDLVNYSLNIN
jgi:hypothetical protein